ncbi:hypothetical protein Btru_004775 [Bulinus truncatus]|nr:hypothetical protein Btru_004775 [Bulinus truncatus]
MSSIFNKSLFRNKVAIVIGGGTGIGKGITKELLYLGCNVMIASRKEERLQQSVDELNGWLINIKQDSNVHHMKCNIRSEEDVKNLLQGTLKTFGKLDFLVNNGGGQFLSRAEDITLKGWDAVIETNLTGTFLMCREVGESDLVVKKMVRGTPVLLEVVLIIVERSGLEHSFFYKVYFVFDLKLYDDILDTIVKIIVAQLLLMFRVTENQLFITNPRRRKTRSSHESSPISSISQPVINTRMGTGRQTCRDKKLLNVTQGHTGAARSAVDNLTKTLSLEWIHSGVRINCVAPGSSIYSETAAANYGDVKIFDAIKTKVPMHRLGTVEEISSAVCFLLSPGASFITGETLKVDAGQSLYSCPTYTVPEHDKTPAYSWQDDVSGEEIKD